MMTARFCASLVVGAVVLAGCVPEGVAPVEVPPPVTELKPAEPAASKAPPVEPVVAKPAPDPALVAIYAARADGERTVPAIDVIPTTSGRRRPPRSIQPARKTSVDQAMPTSGSAAPYATSSTMAPIERASS